MEDTAKDPAADAKAPDTNSEALLKRQLMEMKAKNLEDGHKEIQAILERRKLALTAFPKIMPDGRIAAYAKLENEVDE